MVLLSASDSRGQPSLRSFLDLARESLRSILPSSVSLSLLSGPAFPRLYNGPVHTGLTFVLGVFLLPVLS